MDSRNALLTALLLICALQCCRADLVPVSLSNGYFSLDVIGTGITRLEVDPRGRKLKSIGFAENLWPEFWHPTADTRITVDGTTATISNLEVREYRGIATNRTDSPVKLEPGHTLAQTFRVPEGAQLASAEIRLPTWSSRASGVTLNLYLDGKILASKKLKNVSDNSWQSIAPDTTRDAGLYTVEIADPVGDIGWWSSDKDVSPIGEALLDGKPVGADRALQVHMTQMAGRGSLAISLDGDKLDVDAEFTPTAEMQHKTFPWRWRTTWTKDGYDCTPKSGTVFSRFFTDNQRYVPIQWFKRRDTGAYSFDGCKWIEMDGTANADLRLEGDDLHLHWELRPDEMHLRFDTPLVNSDDKVTSHFTLVANKRDDAVPDDFPRFSCSDKAVERDLNTFWWERAFTYPAPPNRCIEFSEWMALMRSWYDGPQRDGEIRHLEKYQITDEGYVHTYGNIVGWPLVPNRDTRHFDTNARFILACWRHWLWTGDMEFLRGQAERLRKAMNYQLEVLKGKDGLIVTPDFKTGRHEDLSNNYWDILPFGHLDAYANAAFYGSLNAMAQIEEALRTLNAQHPTSNVQPGPEQSEIQNPKSEIRSPSFYRTLAKQCHKAYDDTFWLQDKGRYAGCVDIDGVKHDYGFTFVNLEALFYGLGDAEKAKRIYKWMETEPTSSGKPDTYTKWIFAPRANTIHNPQWGKAVNSQQSTVNSVPATINHQPSTIPPWWTYWWAGTPYGDQCQDGGAILYTSFFDLMDRVKYRGADNAWQRFMEILGRYRMPDHLCGGSPLYLGEKPQQEGAGSVGVDMPFPESGLVPTYFLYGVIGLHATPDGLRISPNLPKAISYAGVEHVSWRGARLSIRVTRGDIEISGTDRNGKPVSRKYSYRSGGSIMIKPSDLGAN